jgi:hypothetical protein
MAQLVVLICLLATPTECTEKPVPGATTSDVVSCLKTAGDKADEWQRGNSQYFVIGWRCQAQKKEQ